MGRLTRWIDRTFYPQYEDRRDDRHFRDRILAALTPDSRALDLGAGRGGKDEMNFRGHCQFVAGVDPDAAVLDNPYAVACLHTLRNGN